MFKNTIWKIDLIVSLGLNAVPNSWTMEYGILMIHALALQLIKLYLWLTMMKFLMNYLGETSNCFT